MTGYIQLLITNNITTVILNIEHNLKPWEMLYGHTVFQSISGPPDKVMLCYLVQFLKIKSPLKVI